MHLLIHQYLQRPIESVELRELSEPLRLQWPISQFTDNVEVYLPEAGPNDEPVAETFVRLQATLLKSTERAATGTAPTAKGQDDNSPSATHPREQELELTITQAERPGIYRVRRFDPEGSVNDTVIALNVPTSESALAIADQEQTHESGRTGSCANSGN